MYMVTSLAGVLCSLCVSVTHVYLSGCMCFSYKLVVWVGTWKFRRFLKLLQLTPFLEEINPVTDCSCNRGSAVCICHEHGWFESSNGHGLTINTVYLYRQASRSVEGFVIVDLKSWDIKYIVHVCVYVYYVRFSFCVHSSIIFFSLYRRICCLPLMVIDTTAIAPTMRASPLLPQSRSRKSKGHQVSHQTVALLERSHPPHPTQKPQSSWVVQLDT